MYTQRPVLSMLFLGFSAGLPFYLVFQTLSAWLRQEGIERATIGMLAWVGLTYSIKFLWSPIVDRFRIPLLFGWLGRRRSWMLFAQIGIAAGIANLATSDPVDGRAADRGRRVVPRFLLGDAGHRDRCLAHRIRLGRSAGRDGGGLPDRLSRGAHHRRRRRARHRAGLRLADELYGDGGARGRRHRDDAARARAQGFRIARICRGARRGSSPGSNGRRIGRPHCASSARTSSAPSSAR